MKRLFTSLVPLICLVTGSLQSFAQQQWDEIRDYIIDSNNTTLVRRDFSRPFRLTSDSIFYYASFNWSTSSPDAACIYTIVIRDGDHWLCTDYIKSSGIKLHEITFKDQFLTIPDGKFAFYFLNGQTRYEGFYESGRPGGHWEKKDKANDLILDEHYTNGFMTGKGFSKNKQEHINNIFELDSTGAGYIYKQYNNDPPLYAGRFVAENIKDSIWIHYSGNAIIHTVEYSKGDTITETCYNDDGSIIAECISKPPSFIGGNDSLSRFLRNNVRYPSEAIDEDIQGTVVIRFEVNILGEVLNPEILYSPHPILSKEALRVLKAANTWNPGYEFGRKKAGYFMLPVTFRLQ